MIPRWDIGGAVKGLTLKLNEASGGFTPEAGRCFLEAWGACALPTVVASSSYPKYWGTSLELLQLHMLCFLAGFWFGRLRDVSGWTAEDCWQRIGTNVHSGIMIPGGVGSSFSSFYFWSVFCFGLESGTTKTVNGGMMGWEIDPGRSARSSAWSICALVFAAQSGLEALISPTNFGGIEYGSLMYRTSRDIVRD